MPIKRVEQNVGVPSEFIVGRIYMSTPLANTVSDDDEELYYVEREHGSFCEKSHSGDSRISIEACDIDSEDEPMDSYVDDGLRLNAIMSAGSEYVSDTYADSKD